MKNKQKASILHLWLIIDPFARTHAQERKRLVDEEGDGLLAVLLNFLQDPKDTDEVEGF